MMIAAKACLAIAVFCGLIALLGLVFCLLFPTDINDDYPDETDL